MIRAGLPASGSESLVKVGQPRLTGLSLRRRPSLWPFPLHACRAVVRARPRPTTRTVDDTLARIGPAPAPVNASGSALPFGRVIRGDFDVLRHFDFRDGNLGL